MDEDQGVAPIADSSAGAADSSPEVSFDVEAASNDLARDMFPEREESAPVEQEQQELEPQTDSQPDEQQQQEQQIEAKPAPKTWPKEMHEHWSKTPKEVQDYWEKREKQMLDGLEQYKDDAQYGKQMKDAITPYMALIQAQNISPPQAVQTLLNAHYKLSVSSPSQKAEYFQHLAKQYGVDLGQTQQSDQQQTDPIVRQLQDEIHNLKTVFSTQTQQQLDLERQKIQNEVEKFASDPSHPYFDEVADDIVIMLKSGMDLERAYEKAVWANPVVRQKELTRIQTENEAKLKERAIAEAAAKKKAAEASIRNRDSQRTPTGPRATMSGLDSALRETMREIKSRH